MNSGEHQRHRSGATVDRHTAESRNSTRFSFHDTEAFATSIGQQNKRCYCIRLPMSPERRIQIDIGDDLSVDDDKRLAFEEGARVIKRAAGAEYYGFVNV